MPSIAEMICPASRRAAREAGCERKAAYEAVHPETRRDVAGGVGKARRAVGAKLAAAASFTHETASRTGKSTSVSAQWF